MIRSFFLLSFCVAIVLSSCKKVEGPGGTSSIKGKIHINVYDVADNLINEYDAPEERVYLIYGSEDTFHDDDVRTSYDGTFEFPFLQNGIYQVFVYEDCNACPSGQQEIVIPVEISEKNSTIDLGTIDIRKQ